LVRWLILALAFTHERLYRLRHLRPCTHPVRTVMELLRLFWFSL